MTSKEEYKGHVRALLVIWIRQLEQSDHGGDPNIEKVIKAMYYEKEGKEVPEELLQ